MARIPQRKARKTKSTLMTWTRFHLPREQEWPTWSTNHDDIHVGPLLGAEGFWGVSLGRMVDNPEQAVYIIKWSTMDDVKNFQSSQACTEFLRNLPEYDNSQASVESGSALSHLNIDDASSLSPPAASRFLTFKHALLEGAPPWIEVEGRVTFTAFVVQGKIDGPRTMWPHNIKSAYEYIPWVSVFRINSWIVWLRLLAEDRWVEKTFGKLEQQTQGDDSQGRTIFCRLQLWSSRACRHPEDEAASVADPEAVARAMPPATAWAQERWDIQKVPRFSPPEPEFDPEDPEYEREQRELMKEYLQSHGFDVGGGSQRSWDAAKGSRR